TAHCMSKVEAEFMALSPKNASDIKRFFDEAPYWSAKHHGKKYRFMYQVYTSPKYLEYGKLFFKGVEQRYTEYAKQLEPRLNIPWEVIQPMIFTFVRASVHFALFEDELYMKSQMNLLWQVCLIMKEKYKDENFVGGKDYEK
ncbi:MAG: TetR/AcrR family transcriptional regulator, partial [Oscillospiraceae bacterium]